MSENSNDIDTALGAGAALGTPKTTGIGSFTVIPDGFRIHDLEKFEDSPYRKTGDVVMEDASSFVRYFNAHATEHSQIYAKVNPPRFIGVLNDHEKIDAGWRDHRVTYSCPFSTEWKEWTAKDKDVMNQADFAAFIERNLLDIVKPSGAEMLEISRSLQAKKKVNFSSGIRLSNGEQELTYEEEIQGTTAKGKLHIPESFEIGVQVLEGGEPYAVECRLRYRINDANLVMWYELVRPHKIIEDAVAAVWARIETETNRQIYNGCI
ncbi:DUF2303 family protein [Orrella sp. 11846]|uniref:DUF2303 family protein n=1 Tax=Orrella sp. 11846 TaxID=3409913 RepID=UPI003B5A978C